jgi:hypothetical protein
MKWIVALALVAGFGIAGIAAHAAPVKLSKEQLASIAAGAQPQSGQPGLTEGRNGPPPFPQQGR